MRSILFEIRLCVNFIKKKKNRCYLPSIRLEGTIGSWSKTFEKIFEKIFEILGTIYIYKLNPSQRLIRVKTSSSSLNYPISRFSHGCFTDSLLSERERRRDHCCFVLSSLATRYIQPIRLDESKCRVWVCVRGPALPRTEAGCGRD